MLLLLKMVMVMVALVIVGTVGDGCFVGSRLCRDGRVALLMRWGSIAAGWWVHGLVGLCWTCSHTIRILEYVRG